MKIVHINTFPYKATGSIMMNIHNALLAKNVESYVVWGRGREPKNEIEIKMTNDLSVKLHGIYTRLTDKTGFGSKKDTHNLIRKLEEIKPDIVHLHNIHGYYINIELLFNYIKANNIKVVWTFHDCWPFTGHCAYFDAIDCSRWQTHCFECPQKKTYPKSSILDNSTWNYDKKKELFTYENLTIVTPCKWLANLVKKSYLKDCKVEVIYNGIDTKIFHPVESNFKEKNNLSNKKIILGVASEWTERKGLKDFVKLNDVIDHEKYHIVLVGVDDKQKKSLPNNMTLINRTNNVNELVEIYSSADVFFNPTYEDNFPTTNLEAQACGTPVITYNTGGSPESIKNNEYIISKGEYKQLLNLLKVIDANISLDKQFEKENMINRYIELYNKIK